MDEALCRILESTWGSLTRYIQWEAHTDSQPLPGESAMRQGDPWGPLVCALWMTASHREVKHSLAAVAGKRPMATKDDRVRKQPRLSQPDTSASEYTHLGALSHSSTHHPADTQPQSTSAATQEHSRWWDVQQEVNADPRCIGEVGCGRALAPADGAVARTPTGPFKPKHKKHQLQQRPTYRMLLPAQ